MLEIQKSTLNKAIKLLNSIDVKYAILVGEEKHGTLEVLLEKKPTGTRSFSFKYGRGTILNYVKHYIDNLKVGDTACIPADYYELEAVSNIASSYAHKLFGKGGHASHRNKATNMCEILRLEV